MRYSAYLSILTGPIISGSIVYFILSHLLFPATISIISSIIITLITLGLGQHYSVHRNLNLNIINTQGYKKSYNNNLLDSNKKTDHIEKITVPVGVNISIVVIYLALLSLLAILPASGHDFYVRWNELNPISYVQIIISILFCFFLPGYIIINSKENKLSYLSPVAKVILGYLFSIMITSFFSYIIAEIGFAVSNQRLLLEFIYALAIVPFFYFRIWKSKQYSSLYGKSRWFFYKWIKDMSSLAHRNIGKYIVFSGLLLFVILFTYVINEGVIISDQWYHHGRALIFLSGQYHNIANLKLDVLYPPLFPALLAGFFSVANAPSVNAYVSIGILNIIPTIAFYYFFSRWFFPRWSYLSLLATTLFMLGSGFGWTYALDLSFNNPISSGLDSLIQLNSAGIKTFDIRLPTTFVGVGHPDITTGLILIGLPAGFTLLGLLKEEIKGRWLKHFLIAASISTLASFSHDEFNLFIIVSAILPLLYNLERSSFVYAANVLALFLLVLVDLLSPQKYFTVREVFSIPIIILVVLFVLFTWILYSLNIPQRILASKNRIRIRKTIPFDKMLFIIGVIIISVVTYFYLLTYVVWDDLSVDEVHALTMNVGQRDVPWFMYPMKLGLTGLLGLSFILSYFFKRFDKTIFIFGIVAIVAFLLGPFYDEHRFSKYIMVGLSGLATFLIYYMIKIIVSKNTFNKNRATLMVGLLIGLVVVSNSLSIYMFAGYVSLGIHNSGFTQFDTALPRRHFIAQSDIHLLSWLRDTLAKSDGNIAVPINETQRNFGLISKIEGFAGISQDRLLQSPFTLGASTLEGLYKLLEAREIRYIIFPNSYVVDHDLTDVNQFILNNFPLVFQDSAYTVLKVPDILQPTTDGKIALVYPENPLLSLVSNKTHFTYNNTLFDLHNYKIFQNLTHNGIFYTGNSRMINIHWTATIYGNKTDTTLWSNQIKNKFNYLESKFRILTTFNPKDSHAGITWYDGNKTWYAFLRSNVLGVFNSEKKEFAHSDPIEIPSGQWHTMRIVFGLETIYFFIDESLVLRLPSNDEVSISNITKIGIRNVNNIAEFEPLTVGKFPLLPERYYQNEFVRFYPITTVALSGRSYDTFVDRDQSAFSLKDIILTYDPPTIDKTELEFIKNGGRLTVFNTNDLYNNTGSNNNDPNLGTVARLLSLEPTKYISFDAIEGNNGSRITLNQSGKTQGFILKNSSNESILSYYMDGKTRVTPFTIEKDYGKGKIFFVNIIGYFDALSNHGSSLFTFNKRIPELAGLETAPNTNFNRLPPQGIMKVTHFTGDAQAFGNILLKSSSFLSTDNSTIKAESISIHNKNSVQIMKDIAIKDIMISGPYEVSVLANSLKLKSASSNYGYLPVTFPSKFNMTFNISGSANSEIVLQNYSQPIRIRSTIVDINGISSANPYFKNVSFELRKPIINVNGTTVFQRFFSNDPRDPTKTLSDEDRLEIQGQVFAKFDHTDNFRNSTGIQYTSYIDSFEIDGKTDQDDKKQSIIPGEVSQYSKEKGINIDLLKAVASQGGIKLVIIIPVMAVILLWAYREDILVSSNTKRKQL